MRYALTTLAVLLTLLLAACGGGGETATTEATTAATTAATTEATAEATTEATAEATAEATTEATDTMTDTGAMTDTGTMTDTGAMTDTGTMTGTGTMTDTGAMTGTDTMTGTGAMTGTDTMTDTGAMTGAADGEAASATAELMDASGNVVGTATLTEGAQGVILQVDVQNIAGAAAGEHGIHFHQFGACTPDFAAAGEHFNPTTMKHGLDNPEGPHAGDLPNITLDDTGSGTYSATSNFVALSGPNSLLDDDGTALIIHANPDDQVTDPSGNSGDRIVCGVITAAQ